MRRILSLIAVLIMCAAVMSPITVSADRFVPSIGYKDGPGIGDAELIVPGDDDDGDGPGNNHGDGPGNNHGGGPGNNNGGGPGNNNGVGPKKEKVTHCVIITSIIAAEEKSTDISEESRETLLDVYDKVTDGKLELPMADDYVVRELVDLSFRHNACVNAEHTHEEDFEREGAAVTMSFDLGVKAETDVQVLVFKNGEWTTLEDVVNNGDGTVTCTFEQFGTVAFCVEEKVEYGPGHEEGPCLWCWLEILLIALTMLVVLLVWKRRKDRR